MQNENNPLSFVVQGVTWVVDMLARALVALFDGAKRAIDHSNLSLFALVATALPFVLPLPVAFMSSNSAQHFFGWQPWAANVLGFGLEGLGLLAWVRLVDSILDVVRSSNRRLTVIVVVYGLVAVVYEILLIFLNTVLAYRDGADSDYIIVLTCICLLPALSATIYGAHRQATERALECEKQEAREQKERERQERRQDRRELQELKIRYAAGAPRPEVKDGPPFRSKRS